jgi:uncharacterized protein YhjY with autotransporter beta-barrel domain
LAYFVLTPSEARADCIQSGRNVDCPGRDPDGFLSSDSLDVHIRPNALVRNLFTTEVVGTCPLSLPAIVAGPASTVLNEGFVSTFGVCGFGISVDRDSAVTNSGRILTHDYISFGIVSGDNGAIRNSGLISTTYQGSVGVIGGDQMRVTVEAGGRISTTGHGAHGIEVGANALVTNDGNIAASGDTAFGITAATRSTVINNGSIETSANNSIGVKITDGSLTNTGLIRNVLTGPAFAPTPTTGVSMNGSAANFTNTASGVLQATHIGVRFDGINDATLANAGRIEVSSATRFDGTPALNGGAIVVAGTAPTRITNTGVIVAHDALPAVRSFGPRVYLTNDGTITGDVLLSRGDDVLTYREGSTIEGTVDFGAGSDLLILQGSGILSISVVNLEILSKSGDGTFVLAHDLTVLEQVNVFDRSGIVINPGVRLTSRATGNSGVLRGAGIIDGPVTNSGLIAPGTDAAKGTLTVTGAFHQFANGTLAVRLSPDGSSDKLIVGGPLTLAGTLALTYEGTAFRDGQRFDIVTPLSAPLPSAGQFALAAPDLPFVKADLVATSSGGVAVEIDRLSYSTAGATEGQRSVGRLLDRLQAAPPAPLRETLEQLEFSSPDAATDILESLAPEAPGGIQNLGLMTLERLSQGLQHHVSFDASRGHFAWARGFSSNGRSRDSGAGADYNLHGAIAGVNIPFDKLHLGLAAARTGGDFTRGGSAASFDTSLIALTAGARWDAFGIDAAIAYGNASPDMRRMRIRGGIAETLASEANTDLWSASLGGTYEKEVGPVLLSPHVGAAYHRVNLSAVNETGVLAVRTTEDTLESLRARLGARVSTILGRIRPYGDLSLSAELMQRMPRISASFIDVPNSGFDLYGDARRHIAVDAQAGIAVAIADGLEGHIAGTMTANDLLAGRTLTAGLTFRW